MSHRPLCAGLAALALVAAAPARATLIGVVQGPPDVTLTSSNTLIYDSTAINGSTGLLMVLSGATSLTPPTGSAVTTQSYLNASDQKLDVMLTFAVNNTTGALVANPTFNKVTIGTGYLANSNWAFSWQGNISQIGFAAVGNTNFFDARWTMTADQYFNVPAAQQGTFFNGAFAGYPGGMKFNSSGATALTGNIWAYDWVRGAQAGTAGSNYSALLGNVINPNGVGLGAYSGVNISKNANRAVTTVTADVWVPLPTPALLLLSGLAAFLAPALRRRQRGEPGSLLPAGMAAA